MRSITGTILLYFPRGQFGLMGGYLMTDCTEQVALAALSTRSYMKDVRILKE